MYIYVKAEYIQHLRTVVPCPDICHMLKPIVDFLYLIHSFYYLVVDKQITSHVASVYNTKKTVIYNRLRKISELRWMDVLMIVHPQNNILTHKESPPNVLSVAFPPHNIFLLWHFLPITFNYSDILSTEYFTTRPFCLRNVLLLRRILSPNI